MHELFAKLEEIIRWLDLMASSFQFKRDQIDEDKQRISTELGGGASGIDTQLIGLLDQARSKYGDAIGTLNMAKQYLEIKKNSL